MQITVSKIHTNMSEALLSQTDVAQEIYSSTTELGVSFMIPCTTLLHKFLDNYNNTKIYSNQKFPHYIIRCSSSGLVHLGRRKCELETD
jgi:tRNA splicing ligase